MKRVRVVVGGRVQGVWFRASTHDMAVQHDLAGWVRNMPDGSVEAVFEGQDADVEAAIAWCQVGPEHARVDRHTVTTEPVKGLKGFQVR